MHAWVVTLLLASDGASNLQQALELERRGDDAAALSALERLARDRPGWVLPRLEAGRLRLKTGLELERAQLHLDVARSLAPESPRAHYLWGLLAQEQGRLAEAAGSLEIALHYREDFQEARFRLAGLYCALGDWPQAEAQYRLFSRAQPTSAAARLQLALAIERQGRVEDAERELRQLQEDLPSPLVAAQLAGFYQRTHREELAEKVRRSIRSAEGRKMRKLQPSRR